MLRAELITDPVAAHPFLAAWDELAVAAKEPYCSPAWMTAWWKNASPKGSRLRIVLAFDGHDLVGVAPFFADRGRGGIDRYRILGTGCSSRLDLLARPGAEAEAAAVMAATVAGADPIPAVLMFEGTATRSPWPGLLASAWPARGPAAVHRVLRQPGPVVRLDGDYPAWVASVSGKVRQNMRRHQRQLESLGAVIGLAQTHEEVERSLRAFTELHYRRWRSKGGSGVLNPNVERMLHDVGRELGTTLRFRLWSIEVDGEIISCEVFLSAGGETSCWLGGFDERWSRLSPSKETIRAALEHSFDVGDERLDLGTGGQPYKYDFTDEQDTIEWVLVVPRGPASAVARAQLLPLQARMWMARSLSPGAKRQVVRARSALSRALGRDTTKDSRPPA